MLFVAFICISRSMKIEINNEEYYGESYNDIISQYGQDVTTITSIIYKEGYFEPVYFQSSYSSLREIIVPAECYSGTIKSPYFKGLASLQYVEFGGCTKLTERAFENCKVLHDAIFPQCSVVEKYAFVNCNSLTNIYFPSAIEIGYCSFKSTAIYEARFDSLTTIRSNDNTCYTFQFCSNLKYAYFPYLPKLLTYMFRSCTNLKEVYAPECTYLETKVFEGCTNVNSLTLGIDKVDFSYLSYPYKLTDISFRYATSINLSSFSKLTNLVICKLRAISEIPESLFKDYRYLREIELPNVIQINKDAFQGCPKLTTLSLRKLELVDSSSPNLFEGCVLLKTIYMPDDPPKTFHKDTFKGLNCKIIIPLESSKKYDDDLSIEGDQANDGYWCGIPLSTQTISVKFNDDNNIIKGNQLAECITKYGISESKIKSIIIENGILDNIPDFVSTLNSLSSLEDVTITNLARFKDPLTQGIFSGLTISSIEIDVEIESIPTECFKDCTNLRKAYINNCQTADDSCFSGCVNLQEVVLNVEKLNGDNHFQGCTSLETVSLRKLMSVSSYSEHIFTDCPLTSIYLNPSGPPSTFHKNTFSGKNVIIQGLTNDELKTYDANTNVEGDVANDQKWCGISLSNSYIEVSLNDNEFVSADTINDAISLSGVSYITEVNIKGGMIKKSHFAEIAAETSLTSLIIQETATLESYILDASLFKDMTSLIKVSIKLNVSLSEECFSGCTSLTSVDFGSANLIGEKCFYDCTSLNYLNIPNCYILKGDYVFGNCKKLESIDLSALKIVSETASSIFNGCTNLKRLYLPSKEPYKFNKNVFAGLSNIEIILPFKDDYIFYDDNSYVDDDEPEDNTWCGIKYDPKYASFIYHFKINDVYYKRRTLSNIRSKQTLRSLKSNDLELEIKSFELVEGSFEGYDVKTITYGCSTLEVFIAQPLTLNELLPDTFYGCTSLKEITILSNASLGTNSLQELSSLTNLTLSYTNYLYSYQLYGDNNLKYVQLPLLNVVPQNLFSGFDKLTDVYIPSATILENGCFMNCVSLSKLDLSSIKTLNGDSHFKDCTNLMDVDLSSLEIVDKQSSQIFENCKQLKTLKLPNEPPKMFNENIFVNAGSVPSIELINDSGWINYIKQSTIDQTNGHYIWYGFDSKISTEQEVEKVETKSKSGHSNGALAAAIIISILGAAAISAGITYFVVKKKGKVENSQEP